MTNLAPRNAAAIRRATETQADYVPHVDIETARILVDAARASAKHPQCKERDGLFLATLYDAMLRVSECLSLTLSSLRQTPEGWSARITGKGKKIREVGLSPSLVAQLHSYAYQYSIGRNDRIFPFTRWRAHQITTRAFEYAGVEKPPGTGHNHIFRHSGALAFLEATGNPKALQDQLGHSQAAMTLRYMKTQASKESLKIKQGVHYRW